jgi:hypothetical protein
MAEFDQTTASRAVLIEVANVLGAFRNHLVVVGGWVPELLFPNQEHIGSLDVDLAVAPTALSANAYQTICARMRDAGYSHHTTPTRFSKKVAGASEPVKVDLISGEYSQGEKSISVQVNELQINSVRGIDLAFAGCDEMEITGRTPDGSVNAVRARVVRPEVFVLIKAFALDERMKEKDAYDIAFVLHHFEPTLATLAERMQPHVVTGLGREAFEILRAKFAAIDSVGPVGAAQAVPGTKHDIEQLQRAAYEDAQELFHWVDSLNRPNLLE